MISRGNRSRFTTLFTVVLILAANSLQARGSPVTRQNQNFSSGQCFENYGRGLERCISYEARIMLERSVGERPLRTQCVTDGAAARCRYIDGMIPSPCISCAAAVRRICAASSVSRVSMRLIGRGAGIVPASATSCPSPVACGIPARRRAGARGVR